MIANCIICSTVIHTYPAHVKRGGAKYCSYKCMGTSRKGKKTYERTAEHNRKMSELIKSKDLSKQAMNLSRYNLSKKGKTYDEIFGKRADEIRKNVTKMGRDNPNWKGGKMRNKYPWEFFQIRRSIIDRDGNKCMNCMMTDDEHKEKFLKHTGLTIHHIDYNKLNNDPSNLITLCIWCNCRANSRRDEWQKHYHALLG